MMKCSWDTNASPKCFYIFIDYTSNIIILKSIYEVTSVFRVIYLAN